MIYLPIFPFFDGHERGVLKPTSEDLSLATKEKKTGRSNSKEGLDVVVVSGRISTTACNLIDIEFHWPCRVQFGWKTPDSVRCFPGEVPTHGGFPSYV